ncbi:MAG: hypothetical protein R3E55_13220 [Burkholderiaceae bacterium]
MRAVLGQQITVAAARMGQRLVERFGEPLPPWPELHRLFPTPAALAQAEAMRWGS